MSKVTMIISSLTSGGAERVLSNMANYWSDRGWDVTFITFTSNDDFYELSNNVNRISLDKLSNEPNKKSRLINFISRVYLLRKQIKKSQTGVVISFLTAPNITTILATLFLDIKVIISERSVPFKTKISFLKRITRSILYRLADKLVVQSLSVKRWAVKFVPPQKVEIIPNPIGKISYNNFVSDEIREFFGTRNIVAMGRLEKVKGFDVLIKAFHLSTIENPEVNLIILGEGKERENLEKLIHDLNLSDKVYLPGRVENPHGILKQSDVFVLSSFYEGFPNALIEAMSLGLPVIASDCPGGASEIIIENENGLVSKVGDFEDLSRKINLLLSNKELAEKLSKNAININEKLHPEKVMKKWEKIILPNKRRM